MNLDTPSPEHLGQAIADRRGKLLSAYLRWDLLTPVEAMLQFCSILLEDALNERPDAYYDDIKKMHAVAYRLWKKLKELLNAVDSDTRSLETLSREDRHEIRNHLNEIGGYCQLVLLEEETSHFGTLADDLRKIYGYCQECEQKLLRTRPDEVESDPTDASKLISQVIKNLPSTGSLNRKVAPGFILVVDDNTDNRDVLARQLQADGHCVTTAANGRLALAALEDQPADEQIELILLDVVMPEMNGLECLQCLKTDDRWRRLPVIMVSALDDLQGVAHCIEMGAEDFLPKPSNRTILQAKVNASLERKRLRDREARYLEEIEKERQFSDQLLHDLLPARIVKELKDTKAVQPRRYDNVAVLFADIVGFTSYCDVHPPEEVVQYLRGLVESWDDLALRHGLQKIKTIGDAFMAVGGLLEPLPAPVLNSVRCGLEMIASTQRLPNGWNLRVGIHIGQVVAGVLGKRQNLFDLWGDTVNTAARMESNGEPGFVTLSPEAWQTIRGFSRGKRRRLIVKGKGEMELIRFESFANEPGSGTGKSH
jgi:class 3 adenylate cyclase